MNGAVIRANAKINLSLSVEGRRADGYHNIDTVMQSVDLYDTVSIRKSRRLTVDCKEVEGEKNIAFKAARLFFAETGITGGAEIAVEKRIPTEAGLGGGSADAAAVLAGLDRIYETGLSKECLAGLALRLGADVPFMLLGGTVRAKGTGEILEPLKPLENCCFIVAKTERKSSTGEMYAALDRTVYIKPDIEKTVRAAEAGDICMLGASLGNSFSALWTDTKLEQKLKSTGAAGASLSGSGPARFAVYTDKADAESARKRLRAENIYCFLCAPAKKSLIFE